ncbi:hypothetical protein CEQ21_25580 [Niallia circulans]|uniref:Uncharacterized protein n=1 Tax=Niallia circulans TaxID=1397 RepID=A0A553SP15_NIACI|nr:hypothetical protein [Niallia circulans]TRZ38740.1 hypothetical protein CEQ21_25580 [Niallia circulans]
MNGIRIGQGLYTGLEQAVTSRPLELRQGQVIMGHVNKYFTNNMAEIQVGSQKVLAELSTALNTDKNYWFQVQEGDGKLALKVLSPISPVNNDANTDTLLEQWSLPNTKEMKQLTTMLLKENLPLSGEILSLAGKWMKESDSPKALDTIKEMIQRELPFTKEVFASLMSVREGSSMNSLAEKLWNELSASPAVSPALQAVLKELATGENVDLPDASLIKDQLQKLLHTIGYTYEHDLLHSKTDGGKGAVEWNQLKPLLLDLLKTDAPVHVKELASALTDKVTGMQLLSQETGPIMQLMLQFPLHFQNHSMDATMQYSGRKTKDGKIDSDYCRILFYLDLAHLKETAIDMQIQHRIVNITVFNKNHEIEPLMKTMIKGLQEKMKDVQYTLSSLEFKFFQEDKMEKLDLGLHKLMPAYYKGVDYKV